MEKLLLRLIARLRRHTDKFAHVGIGAMVGIFPALAMLPAYAPLLLALFVGFVIEYIQSRYHLGEPDPLDSLATCFGGFLIGLAMVFGNAAFK